MALNVGIFFSFFHALELTFKFFNVDSYLWLLGRLKKGNEGFEYFGQKIHGTHPH